MGFNCEIWVLTAYDAMRARLITNTVVARKLFCKNEIEGTYKKNLEHPESMPYVSTCESYRESLLVTVLWVMMG